jgi:hypothetical protein
VVVLKAAAAKPEELSAFKSPCLGARKETKKELFR